MAQDRLETWHMFPAGNGADETQVCVLFYTPELALIEIARRHWNNKCDLLVATVENQDFSVSEGIRRGFYSAVQDTIVFGLNKPSLRTIIKPSDCVGVWLEAISRRGAKVEVISAYDGLELTI